MLEVQDRSSSDDPQGDRRDGSNAFDLLQLFDGSIQDCAEVAEPGDEGLCRPLDVRARDGEGEQQLDDLVVVEAFESRPDEPLTESLAMAVIVLVGYGENGHLRGTPG